LEREVSSRKDETTTKKGSLKNAKGRRFKSGQAHYLTGFLL